MPSLPTRASLLAPVRARGWMPSAIPPVMLGFSVVAGADLNSPATLLTRCVRAGAVVNPALEAVLSRSGARNVDAQTWTVRVTGPDAVGHHHLVRILRALVPAGCHTTESARRLGDRASGGRSGPSRASVAALLTAELAAVPEVAAAMTEAGLDFTDRRFRDRTKDCGVILRCNSRTLHLTVFTAGFGAQIAGTVGLGPEVLDRLRPSGPRDAVLLTPAQSETLLVAAQEHAVGSLDAAHPGRMAQLREVAAAAVVVDTVAGHPGRAHVHIGAGPEHVASSAVGTALDGVAVAGVHHLTAPVAVHPDVTEAADQALAAPAGREGLRDYQDHFCSVSAVTVHGLVNALDPGMGKTVATAAAFAERAAVARGPWAALVVAPTGVKNQWRSELAKFFPAAEVIVVDSGRDVPAAMGRTTAGTRPVVIVCSTDVATRSVEDLTAWQWDAVALDEADWLTSADSARTRAMWRIRAVSRFGTALTGTPVDRSIGNLPALLAWSRNDPTIAEFVDGSEELMWQRLGGSVFRRRAVTADVPRAVVNVVTLSGAPAEAELAELMLGRVRQTYEAMLACRRDGDRKGAAAHRFQMRADIDAARAASCDPVAARRADPESVWPTPVDGAKRIWGVETTVAAVRGGGQVLVCTDFPASARAFVAAAEGRGLRAAAMTGEVTPAVRTSLAAAFLHGQLDVLCLSGAGARGVNLQSATDLIHADLPVLGATLRQRSARAIRLGSTREKVTVHIPVLAGSIDTAMLGLLQPVLDTIQDPAGDGASEVPVDLFSPAGLATMFGSR
jgi:hypothetical protein